MDATTHVFEKIVTKGYANSKNVNKLNSLDTAFSSIEEFKNSISEDNNVLLQKLMTSGKIKIVC